MNIRFLPMALLVLFFSCTEKKMPSIEPGVSRELALQRKGNISYLAYDLEFSIPERKEEPIQGSVKIGVKLKSIEAPLVLDFNVDMDDAVSELVLNNEAVEYEMQNGHISIDATNLKPGYNEIDIAFTAGDLSLNRSDEFLYTLFVPDRASTAFPCFDQPDLKAKYNLKLEIPGGWEAVANGPLLSTEQMGNRKKLVFGESDLISTYLFSFVAGKFKAITKTYKDISMTMYHRETDQEKLELNAEEIFRQHHQALKWMEEYTDTKYPFQKFDFALIPAFQYNGMEHTGAIQYRDSRLLLDKSATLDDRISRSMLIAHETAHMWFGNLVTMEWFDDVWLKEVFANFMASKITEPNFPEINHDLNFMFSHYPDAYGVDRTEGANPIRQELDNLRNAGSMYGAIIYHKAPIVMRQLELLMGEYAFRDALREYIVNFRGKNASWDDLVEIMDVKTDLNLKKWSKVWISEPGMPFIDLEFNSLDTINEFDIVQYDLTGKNKVWPQKFDVTFAYDDGDIKYPVYSDDVHFTIQKNLGTAMPQSIEMNSNATGYGIFVYGLDYIKDDFMFNRARVDIPSIQDDLSRGAAYLVLHEYLLHEGMNPLLYLRFLEEYIYVEENELILTYLLNNLELIYWKFLTVDQSKEIAQEVESLLIQKMAAVNDIEIKHLIFKKYISMAQSDAGIRNLMNFWGKTESPGGIELTENEFVLLAYHIQLKANQITEVLKDQIARLDNPDRRSEVEFVSKALALNAEDRDAFFQSLLDPVNRERESWVNTALYYLNHPLRAKSAIKYLEPMLMELPEIQKTGDIFFPKRWLDNALWGYNTSEAVEIINNYLQGNHAMDEKLRQKVLQSVDMVFRAERDISKYAKGS